MNPQQPEPLFHAPFQEPVPPAPVVTPPPQQPEDYQPQPKSKLTIILVAAVIILALLTMSLALALATKSGKSSKPNGKDNTNQAAKGPEAATSTSIQLINDSVSQDISGLNEDKDFPADRFSDKALGL